MLAALVCFWVGISVGAIAMFILMREKPVERDTLYMADDFKPVPPTEKRVHATYRVH